MIYAIILSAVTYVLMLTFGKYRPHIAPGSAAVIPAYIYFWMFFS